MANRMAHRIWDLDSLGIISSKPVFIHGYVFYPNQQADAAQFVYWDENDTPAAQSIGVTYTNTDSTDTTVTSTGNFASTWADGKVAKITKTTGSDTGKYGLIKTAGNNNAFVTHLMPFTTEASKVGDFYCYTTYNALKLKHPNDTNEEGKFVLVNFLFPNLALDSLSTSAGITLYIG